MFYFCVVSKGFGYFILHGKNKTVKSTELVQ